MRSPGLPATTAGPRAAALTCVSSPLTAAEAKDLCQLFQTKGSFKAEYYTGDMDQKRRSEVLHNFLAGELQIVWATEAFGMGIDVPNLPVVVLYGAPKSMESYFQKIGRAGRNGELSECLLIANSSDFNNWQLMHMQQGNKQASASKLQSIEKLYRYFFNVSVCRWLQLARYFENKDDIDALEHGCGRCDVCESQACQEGRAQPRDFTHAVRVLLEALCASSPTQKRCSCCTSYLGLG
eukprot:6516826-Prymnesium_polylepis.1